MKQKLIFLFALVLMGATINAQKSKYVTIGLGTGSASFIDFATSPLEYSGNLYDLSLAYNGISSKYETLLGLNIGRGGLSDEMTPNPISSTLLKGDLYYSKLFALNKSDSWNVKVGAMMDALFLIRVNTSLMNNAVGRDLTASLMGVGKVTKDISSSRRKRSISFTADVGLLNIQVRNKYIYTTHTAGINGAEYDDYRADRLKGLRFKTGLEYMHYLSNNNVIGLAYIWDTYKTTGVVSPFQFASHSLKFTLFFNTNNK